MPNPERDAPVLAEVAGLSLRLGPKEVLEDVDLNVRAGEIVSLIGPNGGGKTSLLRVLLGLVKADSGHVALRSGIRLGYMPQRLSVDEVLPLTVARFLELGNGNRGEKAATLAEVGADEILDSPIQSVSGGEMQRVLLARALMRSPDLLVLDEPAHGVDVSGQAEMFALLGRIRERRGCGILLVSHDLHLVMAATDKVVCLNRHVCCTGQPESVSRHPEYIALFGAAAGRGFAVYSHIHNHGHDAKGAVVPAHPLERDAYSGQGSQENDG